MQTLVSCSQHLTASLSWKVWEKASFQCQFRFVFDASSLTLNSWAPMKVECGSMAGFLVVSQGTCERFVSLPQ